MLPEVIIHNAVSIDGRITKFEVDMEQYYHLATGFGEDATLVGSNTILSSGDEIEPETTEDLEVPDTDPNDKRPILVIPDSKGRVRIWHALRKWPYWRHFVALVTETTPNEYLGYLEKRNIEYIKTGTDKVNLRDALEALNKRYGVKKIRADSGGILNGLLLRDGIVTTVSILVHPALVGGVTPKTVFDSTDQTQGDVGITLKLDHMEKLKNDLVWLRYNVIK
jgi:2,5-diamino-6-(ribosylamino)-4(3H)-pyrimidinone 5'-phosphate reductase